jgi:hypothetical protein
VTLPTSEEAAACGYRFDQGGRCGGDEVVSAGIGHRERAERVSAYRSLVFWSGSGLILLAVTGGLAWVMSLPGGRVAVVSGQAVAREPGDGVDSAGRPSRRTE